MNLPLTLFITFGFLTALLQAGAPYETSKNGFVFLPASGSGEAILSKNLPKGPGDFAIPQPKEAARQNIVDVAKHSDLRGKISPDAPDNLRGFQEIFSFMEEKYGEVPSKLILPPGEYRVKVKSKNDFVLKNKRDFTLDGNGATIVFSYTAPENGKTVELFLWNLNGCLNTKIVNLKIDWDWENYPLASLVEVVGLGAHQETIRIRVADFNEARRRQFDSADSIYSDFQPFDAERGMIGVSWVNKIGIGKDAIMTLRWGSTERKFFEEKVDWDGSEATLRPLPEQRDWVRNYVRVGFRYLVRHYVYTSTAFVLNACTNTTVEHVTIFSAPGMGLSGKGKTHHTWLKRFQLVNKPGTYGKRWCTATADGINFGSTLGFIKIEDSRVENNLDDGLNFHDFLHIGVKLQDKKNLILETYQPRTPFDPGDIVEVLLPDLHPLTPPFLAEVVGRVVTPKSGNVNRFATLELSCELPGLDGVDLTKVIVLNRSYNGGNYIIRNVSISGNKGRGILLQTPNGLVENCRVTYNRKHALSIDIEAGSQGEGYGPTNIVVRNCVFENNNIETVWNPFREAPVIRISAFCGAMWKAESELAWGVIRDILIISNVIKSFPGVAMQINACADVTIGQNLFQNTITEPKAGGDYNGSIWVNYAKGLQVVGNRWSGSENLQNRGLYFDQSQVRVQDILFQGNAVDSKTKDSEGDLLKISLRGLKPGIKHELKIVFRTGPDGGIYRIEDGDKLLEDRPAVDTYAAIEGNHSEVYRFVTPPNTLTEMKIRFVCQGKNEKSSNYFLKRNGLDTKEEKFSISIAEAK